GLDAPTDRPFDGESLLPRLRGERRDRPRQLFWLGRAMRDGRWKLVVQKDRALLFDLSEDLGERRDVADRHPERVARMHAALAEWREDVAR
ncbi:MAG: N-acetylgalactosamine 6-sulfatase (GALNS), partial [Planctomycetes bacterium]|nr:N-acetylgalactosamine 6-sulfatase (GALNS) [Planctomycetota bacterium]